MKYEIKTPALIKHMYPEWWEKSGEWFNDNIEKHLNEARVLEFIKIPDPISLTYTIKELSMSINDKVFNTIVMGPYIPKGAEVLAWDYDKKNAAINALFSSWDYKDGTITAYCTNKDFTIGFNKLNCELYTEPKEVTRPYTEEEILDMVISGEWYVKDEDGDVMPMNTNNYERSILHKRGWPKDKWVDPVVVERKSS